MKPLFAFLALQLSAHAGAQQLVQAKERQEVGDIVPSITKTVHHTIMRRTSKVHASTLEPIKDMNVAGIPTQNLGEPQTLESSNSGRPTGEKPTITQDTMAGAPVVFGAGRVKPNVERTKRDATSNESLSLSRDDLHSLKLGLVDSEGYISINLDSADAVKFCRPVPVEQAVKRHDKAESNGVRPLLLELGTTTNVISVPESIASKFCRKLELSGAPFPNTTTPMTLKTAASSKQAPSATDVLAEVSDSTSLAPKSKKSRSTTSSAVYTSEPITIKVSSTLKSKKSKPASTQIAEATSALETYIDPSPANDAASDGGTPADVAPTTQLPALAAGSEVSRTTSPAHTFIPAQSRENSITASSPHDSPTISSSGVMYEAPSSDQTNSVSTQEIAPEPSPPFPLNSQAIGSTDDAPAVELSSINSWYDYINSFMKTADVGDAQTSALPESSVMPDRDEESRGVRRRRFGMWVAHAEVIKRGPADVVSQMPSEDVTVETMEEESSDEDGEVALKTPSAKVKKVVPTSDTAQHDDAETTRKMVKPTAVMRDLQAGDGKSPVASDEEVEQTPSAEPINAQSPDDEVRSTPPSKTAKPSSTHDDDDDEDDVLLPPAKPTKSTPLTDDDEDDVLTSSTAVSAPKVTSTPAPADTDANTKTEIDLENTNPSTAQPHNKPKPSPRPSTSKSQIPILSSDISFDFPAPTTSRHHSKPPLPSISASVPDLSPSSSTTHSQAPSRSKSSPQKGVPPPPPLPYAPAPSPTGTGRESIDGGGGGAIRWDPSCIVNATAKECWVSYTPSSEPQVLPEHDKASSAWGVIYDKKIKWTVILGWTLLGLEIVVGVGELVRGIYGGGVGVGGLGGWMLGWLPRHVPPFER